jgi:hypothetical protein
VAGIFVARSPVQQHFFDREADVLRDLTKKNRGDVSAGVEGHGRAPPVSVPVLLVRPALPRFGEAEFFQDSDDLARLQDGVPSHLQATFTV